MVNAQQAFKAAYSKARTLRDNRFCLADYSWEQNRYFVAWQFEQDVLVAVGLGPDRTRTELRAVDAAALVVAVEVTAAKQPIKTLAERMAHRRELETHDFHSDYI